MPAAELLAVVASLSATVHATDVEPGVVRLDLLDVPEERRGHGLARDALALITRWADETSTSIVLTATYGLGADIARLLMLFLSYGFVPVEATPLHEVRMRREPFALVPARLVDGPLALFAKRMNAEQATA